MAIILKKPMSVILDPAYLGSEFGQHGEMPEVTFYQKNKMVDTT